MTASVPRSADSFTLDNLVDLPDDGNRYELIEGRLLVSPAPAKPHLRCLSHLHRLLLRTAPEDVAVGQNGGVAADTTGKTYFIPDLVVVPYAVLEDDGPALAPKEVMLVVEVLSPDSRTTDEVTKRYYYARMGIPQFWIVDPKARTVRVLRLAADRPTYRDEAFVKAGERWRTDDPFAIDLDPADIC